jgi:N-acetylneuraminic acid mutarotase
LGETRVWMFSFILVGIVVLCLFNVKLVDASGDSWVLKAPMHEARSDLGVATVNGKIYAIGGVDSNGHDTRVNEEYDPATDSWTSKTPIPSSRIDFATAVLQDKIYCIGGRVGGGFTGLNEAYNPLTDSWENKTAMPIGQVAAATSARDKIYVLLGVPNETLTEVYDPTTDSWTAKSPPPFAMGGAATAFDDKIYFIGGFFNKDIVNYTAVTQVYDCKEDTWSLAAAPTTFFVTGSAVSTTGFNAPKKIYVLDEPYGDKAVMPDDPLYINQVYDPATDTWTAGTSILEGCGDYAAAILKDTIYVIGGVKRVGISGYLDGFTPILETTAANYQYLPIGYGVPDPSYQPPTPSTTPSPTPTTTPTATPEPTFSPTSTSTATASSAPLTASPASTQPAFQTELIAASAIAVAVAVAVTVGILRVKRKHKQR